VQNNLLANGVLSINEVRATRGEEPIDGGDDHYVNAGKIPLDLAGLGLGAAQVGAQTEQRLAERMSEKLLGD